MAATQAGKRTRTNDHRIGAGKASQQAVDYLEEMVGEPPEAAIAAEPRDSGWLVTVEMLELARVPETTDVLASYEVELDADGEPLAFRRTRRYYRGWVGED